MKLFNLMHKKIYLFIIIILQAIFTLKTVNLQHTRLAQLVERKALNLVVVGSSPTVGGEIF